jgi:small GTP-binding protein
MAAADYDHLVKLLLLGDSDVGKSSLLMRFCEEKFGPNFVTTIGVDFKWKQVERNGKKLKLQVWDTAGQERFRTITPAYYRAAKGVVITYNVTNKESFDNVEYWIEDLAQHGDAQVQRILVGNKSDLEDDRKVSKADGEALAAKNDMLFFETSAKLSTNVDEAFLQIADQVVEQRYPDYGFIPSPQDGAKKKCAC